MCLHQTPPPVPAPINANEIQAQFAAQVAARAREPSQSEGRNAQGPQLTGTELKPQDATPANQSRRSSEEVKGGKKVEVSIATGTVGAKEPAAGVEPVTKSGSREQLKDAAGRSNAVPETKGLSVDAPSFEMRPQAAPALVVPVAVVVPVIAPADISAAKLNPAEATSKPLVVIALPVIGAPLVEATLKASVVAVAEVKAEPVTKSGGPQLMGAKLKSQAQVRF